MNIPTGIILLVDDSPVNLRLLESILTNKGHQVMTASGAQQALAVMGEQLPDLIVLDILMPGIDGIELCQYLKQDEKSRDIPVIFVSSLDNAEDKLKGFQAGAVDYITKPFHSGEVLARIETHLKLCLLQQELEERNRQLEEEKQKSEALLLNVLPARVARELMEQGSFAPQSFDHVTVCFVDIIGFTALASRLEAETVIRELNEIFTAFDNITEGYACERMKTIGDAYLFVCGIPEKDARHACNVVNSALDMITYLEARNRRANNPWQVRVGVHSGRVVGGIVGTNKYLYDIFGDTVNIAARLQSHSPPMRVNVSEEVFVQLRGDFLFSPPTTIDMKGKGQRSTYLVEQFTST